VDTDSFECGGFELSADESLSAVIFFLQTTQYWRADVIRLKEIVRALYL
jgi:hypothetical protein